MNPVLEVRNLRKAFGGNVAVNGISFSLMPGEIVGLLGPNGSGKTTVINVISGSLKGNGGSVRLDGQEIIGLQPHRIAALGVTRTFQLVRVAQGMSVLDNLTSAMAFTGARLTGEPARIKAIRLLEQIGLPNRSAQRAGDMTYIDQKRLELARALALEPKVLLLDEWLAGLNPTELQEGISLIQTLQESGIAILMVEHVMVAIRALCDRSIVLATGKLIADGPTEQVLANKDVKRAYLGETEDEAIDA
ncbi:ABC transporter ATP-binding protein [Brucella pituitosa]|uniref:ABC transporter ATP-binding protein n=1 Tax=Brucella pituitosa TaxID=571256 RepID=UPI003F4AE3E0